MGRFGLVSNLCFIQSPVARVKTNQSEQKFTAKSIFLDDCIEFVHHHPLNILIICG